MVRILIRTTRNFVLNQTCLSFFRANMKTNVGTEDFLSLYIGKSEFYL